MATLLTVEQYATLTQLHPDSVRRQLRAGRLNALKKGRVWRIPSSEVHADSRAHKDNSWATAAREMADVYRKSLESGDDLTAITSAVGSFYASDEIDLPE